MFKLNGFFIKLASLCIVLFSATLAYAEEVYMYRNKDGVLVFSDTPHPDAETISVENKIDSIPSLEHNNNSKPKDAAPSVSYQIDIYQPKEFSTIRNNESQLHVTLNISPTPAASQQINILLDGKITKTSNYKSVVTLSDVYRGEHKLKVDLVDPNGKLIASSKTVTFYMHQASILNAK